MKYRLLCAYILNLFDLFCAISLTRSFGITAEMNPFMRMLLTDTYPAFIYKAVLIGAALLLLYYLRRERVAVIYSYIALGVYLLLGGYNLVMILTFA